MLLKDAGTHAQGLMHGVLACGNVPPGRASASGAPPRARLLRSWVGVGPSRMPRGVCLGVTHEEGDDGSEGRLHLPAVPGDASDPMPRRLRLRGSRVRADGCAPGVSEPGPLEQRSITFGVRRESSEVSGAEGRG